MKAVKLNGWAYNLLHPGGPCNHARLSRVFKPGDSYKCAYYCPNHDISSAEEVREAPGGPYPHWIDPMTISEDHQSYINRISDDQYTWS